MLFNKDIDITLGNKKIICNSNVVIDKNTKYAIIGQNGIGKTTLMNYIYNDIKETKNINVLYITQSENIDNDCSIFEYMLKSDNKIYDLYNEHQKIENQVLNNDNITNEELDKYNKLTDEIKTENYKKYEAKILTILNGMGFYEINKKIKLLSGGQLNKLSSCKGLLLEPELLLLDEPTNHLDLKNIIWLQKYLIEYTKSLIIITHNIDFFDRICDKTIYFFNIDPFEPKVYVCKGGYKNFCDIFKQKRDNYVNEYNKYCKKINELKKKNDKTELEKFMQKNKSINKPIKDYDITIKFDDVKLLSHDEYANIIDFRDVNFKYDNMSVLENINIGINMKSRYILIGENGSGKSTFFNLCVKKIKPCEGEIVYDSRIRIGYFNQNSIMELQENSSAIEYLQSIDNSLNQQDCRSILAKIGFKKMYENDNFDVGNLLISNMSGGQKVKLVLCGIKIKNPHIILFDEPTNHLDIYSINEFIESINNFNGGIVIITHDAYVIENINNYQLLIMKNKSISKLNMNFENYSKKYLQ